MGYILIKEKDSIKVNSFDLSHNSYTIKLKKREVLLVNQKIIDRILLIELFKKLNPLFKQIIFYLNEETDDTESAGKFLDELAKQRTIILNKYEKYLSLRAREEYLKNIRFLAIELKRRSITYTYVEQKGRRR
ncbi:MAG: hypothetical protein GX265_03710 [Mollicutes bacterium]|jgi:hypothetical protein|nr:hypothetical protein [Mollicutes bacterium]